MIGELREASQMDVPKATPVAGSCPACAATNPGPVGGTCRVCGSPLRLVSVTLPGANSDLTDPDPAPVAEGIVSFARRAWSESLHPRVHGGGGGGEFARKAGGDVPRPDVAATRRPHLEHGPAGGRTARRPSPMGVPQAPRADRPQVASRKLSETELPQAVGLGPWSKAVPETVAKMRSGEVNDSEQFHKLNGGKGPYSPERVALHARIVNLLLQGAQAHQKPEAVFLAGGPASGKSSIVRGGMARLAPDAVDINPDIIKSMLPEFQALVAAGDKRAASVTHEESAHIAKLLMNLALLRQHHVTVDGTGNSGPGKFSGKIEQAVKAGHKPRAIYATIPTDEAVRRAQKRGERSGRVVPEGYIRSAHASVSKAYVEDVAKLGIPIDVYDNSGKAPKLVAQHGRDGALAVKDRKLYADFVEKADPGIAQGRARAKAQMDAMKAVRAEFGGDVGDHVVLGDRAVRR